MTQSPLEYLYLSPETINPAIVTARKIQHLELSGQVTPEMMEELAKEAQSAIALWANKPLPITITVYSD